MHQLFKFVQEVKSNETLMLILAQRSKDMDKEDLRLLNAIIKENDGTYTMTDFEMELKNLYYTYKAFRKLYYTTIVLKWDKETSHFVIKEKGGTVPDVDFLTFLKSGVWYTPVC
jgi:hypothetical protein